MHCFFEKSTLVSGPPLILLYLLSNYRSSNVTGVRTRSGISYNKKIQNYNTRLICSTIWKSFRGMEIILMKKNGLTNRCIPLFWMLSEFVLSLTVVSNSKFLSYPLQMATIFNSPVILFIIIQEQVRQKNIKITSSIS